VLASGVGMIGLIAWRKKQKAAIQPSATRRYS